MFSPYVHRMLFLSGLMGLGAGMSFGTVPTSIPQIILLANWLLEGSLVQKWQLIKNNSIFWILSSVYCMHVLGMIHTIDAMAGMNDLRIKIPLLLLPLIFFTTSPINKKELNFLLGIFSAAVVLSSLWCLMYYFTHSFSDIRKASRFMSHIRFGLYINLCIGVLVYLTYEYENRIAKIICVFSVIYLIVVMLVLGMVTGLVLFGLLCLAYAAYYIFKGKKYRLHTLLIVLLFFTCSIYLIRSEWKKFSYVDHSVKNENKKMSLSGRPYFPPDSLNFHTENGFYITRNIQYDELNTFWLQRSKLNLYSYNDKGILVIWNVIRYMSSKGLTKDSAGLAQLTKEDINHIEAGITNYQYVHASPLRIRLKEFFWEYRDYSQGFNPSGNTLLMRLEFWKAATYIIQRNMLWGVGTGDMKRAFDKAYNRMHSKLSHEWRLRSHNQLLAITVAFGIPGLLLFVFSLIYPAIHLRKQLNKLYGLFYFIAIISFFTEDTLETQSGVSFFAYFNTLFLWLASSNSKAEGDHQKL